MPALICVLENGGLSIQFPPPPILSNPGTLDVPLLRKAVEWAETEDAKAKAGEDSEWDQTTWMFSAPGCGTSFCIAGYLCTLGEEREVTDARHEFFAGQATEEDEPEWDGSLEHQHWADRAAELLGVPPVACFGLFHGSNNIHDVRMYAKTLVSLFGEEGERL